jgi:hypothetical protein
LSSLQRESLSQKDVCTPSLAVRSQNQRHVLSFSSLEIKALVSVNVCRLVCIRESSEVMCLGTQMALFFKNFLLKKFFYSYMHTMFGSFLPASPTQMALKEWFVCVCVCVYTCLSKNNICRTSCLLAVQILPNFESLF